MRKIDRILEQLLRCRRFAINGTTAWLAIIALVCCALGANAQVKNDFDVRYAADIRGELTFIGNNIVNRQTDAGTRMEWQFINGRWRLVTINVSAASPNDPYNDTGAASEFNDRLNMQYIDVDSDPSTFSSSSAVLTIPDPSCSLVRYAGLYWSAVYVNPDRSNIENIRFRMPGGAYQDITADEILFDGNGDVDFGNYSPYAAYRDVTTMVAGLADPNGEYTVANIRASLGGGITGGISGGWTMVVVYENPNLPGSRYITTFDGYAGIQSGQSVDIPVNGFTTLPAPFPVNANIGIAALEGDNRIGGDGLAIDAVGAGTFTPLSNSVNPANNFFNSNITRNDALVTDRTPNSVNTLGWDVDLLEIDNPFNNVIPNDATSAVLRATSTQDKYDIFFTSFDVEIIAPNIVLEKRVNTPGGVDITGQGVNLGQVLDYVLTWENIGNDDATDYTIRDILPVNVSPPDGRTDFIPSDFVLPPGVTYVYTPATREVVFTIPDNLAEEDGPEYSLRMRVQVAENCFDFIDACSDLIQNLAYSTYRGVENSAVITDDPSVTDFNACGFVIPGATNFLLDDLSDCNFSRTVELCGSSAVLDAGDGFDDYIWVRDDNGNNILDPTDTVITDSDPDNDPSTMSVTQAGTYIVDKIVADPCKGFKEFITVTPYGAGLIPNPIIEFFNEVNGDTDPTNDIPGEIVQCSVDNALLPKLFLCGAADTKLLQVNIVDAQSIVWEQLDEGSCAPSGDDCANRALNCNWNQVGTGNNHTVNNEGEYRLSVTYQNGCTSRFYFSVFQNDLDIRHTKEDIICANPGNITITNLGGGYGYQLFNADTNTVVIPFSANNGPSFDFGPGENGTYIVEITQLDPSGVPVNNACIFRTPEIGILDRDVSYNVTPTDATCTTPGAINVQINNAEPNYEYELRLDDGSNGGQGTLIDNETAQTSNNFTFSDLNPGNYIVIARTADGCTHQENVTILDTNDLTLNATTTRPITCEPGTVELAANGGSAPYSYAIWNYEDTSGATVTSYARPQDIPSAQFQTGTTFIIPAPGTYSFVVVDSNNCFVFSNTVQVETRALPTFDPTTVTDALCFGEPSGAIQYNLTNANGYVITFVLFDDAGTELANNTTGFFPNLAQGDYTVLVNQRFGGVICDITDSFTIAGPTDPLAATSLLVQDYTCTQEAIIEANNVTGGTAPYSYSLDGITFVPDTVPNANRFENLTNGTYVVSVRDAAGCTITTDPITINALNEPTDLNFSVTAPNCPTETSEVTVSVTDGNPIFTYEIIAPLPAAVNNANSPVFADLAPGTYTFRATDALGCSIEEDLTILPVERITANGVLDSNVSCLGGLDGALTFTVGNISTTYDYNITGPASYAGAAQTGQTATNIPLTGLGAGTYTITVTDNGTNCTATANITIAEPLAPLALTANATQPTCLDDGNVRLSATGGWGGYNYTVANPDGSPFGSNTSGNFNGLVQTGTYTATVTDANGCVANTTFVLDPAVAPVLEIVPNALCYDATNGLSLTANVISGGNGSYEFSLNGGVFGTTNTFTGLAPGTHTITVRDGNDCTDSASISVDAELTVTASAAPITACGSGTDITITAAGGDGNYVYAVMDDGVPPSPTDFGTNNTVTVSAAGDYDIYVRDASGTSPFCEAGSDITIVQDAPLALSITNSPILCSGENQATLTVLATGGTAPYRYSLDNGTTYQTSNTFANLGAGSYNVRVRDANNCEVAQIYNIEEPFTLSASAAVTQLAECNPGTGAEVRITNGQGGTAPYSYSFDAGLNYDPNPIGFLLPGSHTLLIRDANGCTFPMSVTIDAVPTPPNVSLTPVVDYGCNGLGIVTVLPDNTSLDYTYSLNGTPNTPPNSNVFTDVPVGTQTITVDYVNSAAPTPSTLLSENFGTGANTSISQIDPVYCYEPQDGSMRPCEPGVPGRVNDGEYSVTQVIASPFGTWRSPNDRTALPNGRFLAINVGGVAGVGGIVYAKRGIEVVPNRDITISLWAYNLLRAGTTGGDPSIEIQLVDPSNNLIASTVTGNVPKNNDANDWHNYNVTLNPGTNTNLDIVIRTNSAVIMGNDIAIDDIEAFQLPEQCAQSVTMDVIIEPGNELGAQITAFSDASCAGANDGSITFDATNFGASGFEYQVNGGGYTAPLASGPVVLSGLVAGNYTIDIRDADDASCAVTIAQTVGEPAPVVATVVNVQPASCNDGGAITANATGGTPTYVYQLEDTSGVAIAGYDFATNGNNTVFSSLAPGDYLVRARDTNGCEDVIDTPVTIAPTNPIVFTATPTTCYDGGNTGEIVVNVTSGNGGYQFRRDGGPWLSPVPATATSYTFQNLSEGSYDIEVRDVLGCPVAPIIQTVVIAPQLTANALLTNDLSCLADASVTLTANGGSGSYTYEWSNDGGTTYSNTGFTANVFTTNTFGTFVFRVTDTTAPTACTVVTAPVTINEAQTPVISNVLPTNILCSGEQTGALDVQISTAIGAPPYTIDVVETSGPTNYGTQTTGLPAGNYEVTITDAKGCVSNPFPVSITEPNSIVYTTADVPITCDTSGAGVTNPGEITISGVSGGTGEYTYILSGNNGIPTQTYTTTPLARDHTFTVLEFGIYQVDVVDANGCSSFTTEIIASPPNDLDIDVSTATSDCLVGGTAVVTVGAAVGSGNYQFAILETYTAPYSLSYQSPDVAGGDTATFTGLTPGITYTFVVFDATTNCHYFEEAAAPINTPSAMTATLDEVNNVSCTGAADGDISFTFSGFDTAATEVQYEVFNRQSNVTTGHSGTASVNPPTSVSVNNFATLPPGEYYLLLTEVGGPNNGCSVNGGEFTIRQSANLLDLDVSSPQNDNCNPDAGVIAATGRFGTAPYQYQYLPDTATPPTALSPGWTSAATANVEAGDYVVYVLDAHGCIQNRAITVNEDPSPEISVSIVDECADEGLFQLRVALDNPALASAPFQISVNGSAFQNVTFNASNTVTVSGLSSGLAQSVTVRDLNGCGDTENFDIWPPLQFNASLTTLLDCEVGTAGNAEITIDVVSGSGSYDYEIDGPGAVDQARTAMGGSNLTWTGASVAGDYTVTVYDTSTSVPNCLGSILVNVPPAITPNISVVSATDASCSGADDGTLRVSVPDVGTGPYVFEIISGPGSGMSFPLAPSSATATTATFTGLEGALAPGVDYTVQVTAANGCTDTVSQTIVEPEILSVPAPTVTEFLCALGNNNGNASISIDATAISGGSGSYVRFEFVEEDDPNTAVVEIPAVVQSGSNPVFISTDVAGGSYTINVYDSNGCLGSTTALIAPYDAISSANVSITNTVTCTPGSDGELTMNVVSSLGDPSRFEYSIDNGTTYQASNVFGGLAAGAHTILARHLDTGCMVSASATLDQPNTFGINVIKTSDVVCFGTATGAVNFALVDATYPGGFTWEVFDTNGTPTNTGDDISVAANTEASNGPTADINLPAGSYYVRVTQDNNPFCANIEAFTINGPSTDISGTVALDEITCVGNDGAIELTNVNGGWGGYQYYVGSTAPTAPTDYLPTPRFDTLGPGTYQAWVRDSQGCEALIQDNLVLADPLPINAVLTITQENCTNLQGALEVSLPTGGQGSNYTYQLRLNGADFRAPQTTRTFSGLGAGSYEVTITDQWGCTFTTAAELLYEEMNLTANVIKLIDCSPTPEGQITIAVAGGSSNLSFEVTFPDGSTTLTNTNGVFAGLDQAGTYSFRVTDLDTTAPVCEKTITAELDAPIVPILLPSALSNVSCFGGNDGSITVQLDPTTNTDPVYEYELYEMANLTTPVAGPQTSPLFDNLIAGDYRVRIISSKACDAFRDETIAEPTELRINATATAFACAPDNSEQNAIITVDILDGTGTPGTPSGTPPYLYSLDNVNFQTANTFTVLDTGAQQNLTVYVTDGAGCAVTDTITIDPLNTFTANVGQDLAISCQNPERVTVNVTETGAPGDVYDIVLLPVPNGNGTLVSATDTSATFDLANVGSYTFRVTNTTTNCYVDTAPYTIAPYELIEATAVASAASVCFGDSNGSLDVTITGYTGTFDYEVFTAAGVSVGTGSGTATADPHTLSVPGISGGNYYVQINETDPASTRCSALTNTVTIASPDMPLTANISLLADATCTDDLGQISIVPNGGYAPYDIVMTHTATGTDYTANNVQSIAFEGLPSGAFTITITDDGGCVLTDTAALAPATPIVASATPLVTDLACFGDNGATVSALVSGGGSGAYSYQLNYYDAAGTAIVQSSGLQASPDFNDLGAGTYSITVVDGWNCDVETNTVLITAPDPVTALLLRTDPLTCTTGVTFELIASGGSGTYEYSTDNLTFLPMAGNSISLPQTGVFNAGTYRYFVRDAVNGCDAALSNAVTEDPIDPLTLLVDTSASFINCTGESTAAIFVEAFGGLGNYVFELFTDASLAPASRIAGPQADGAFENLPAGTYYVSVTSEDCTVPAERVVITEPAPLTYTEAISPISCAGESDGSITVTLAGGAGGYRYAISPNLNQFDTVNTFTELAAGNYTIIAQDQNGCFEYLEYTITEPDTLEMQATSTPELCVDSADGTISINISGGTAPYSTAMNSNDDADFVQDRTSFADLATGDYLIFVRDANGCETNTVINVAAGVNLNATVTPVYECTTDTPDNYVNITLEDPTVIGDVLYALDTTDPAAMQLNPDFRNIAPGDHFIAIAHSNGCVQTVDFSIAPFEPLTLTLEQGSLNEITATALGGNPEYTYYFNGVENGADATFYITATDTYEVRVVDENGCEAIANIFMEFIDIEIPNFFTPDGDGQNDVWMPQNIEQFPEILIKVFDRYGRVVSEQVIEAQGWDGKYRGNELPTGDYWYVIKLNGEADEREFVGHFTLYR
ncbi:T9SS type B sorting domain-containing protein [Maribacter sp. 2307ULW6-5]|uniref:T9SS type B sorting domain-containing protein n=1 Tax=Maribacter sp. 2307ULW6-5 TaxID=3386275 RepID=UPI0039BC58AC